MPDDTLVMRNRVAARSGVEKHSNAGATGDVQHAAGDVARARSSQEAHQSRYFLERRNAANGVQVEKRVGRGGVAEDGRHHVGGHDAGLDHVDRDVAPAQVAGDTPRITVDRGLAPCIVRDAGKQRLRT